MRNELQQRAEQAVGLAKKAGADDTWATASRSRKVSFSVRDGKLEEVKDSTSRSLSLRLYVDGRYSAHSTTDLRPDRLSTFVAEAVALTRALQPDQYRSLADPSLFAGRPNGLELTDPSLTKLEREQRLAWCNEMDSRVAGKPQVISATSSASDGTQMIAAASSNGFSDSYESTSIGYYCEVTLEDGDKRPEEWMGAWGRFASELPPAGQLAADALRLARARLGTAKGPTKRTTMVVDQRAAGRMISYLLSPADAQSLQQQQSFWTGKQGQKAVSDKLTIIDDPTIPRGLASRPFDGEGIAAKKLPIIEAGVLRNYYVDTYYGKKLGIAPTTGRASNRVIALGTRDGAAIVTDLPDGIYVNDWLGGNMDNTTGDFSLGVRGHAISNGKLGGPISEMNITGNLLQLFSNLVEVGNDPWKYSSILAPTLVFDGVQFSGS